MKNGHAVIVIGGNKYEVVNNSSSRGWIVLDEDGGQHIWNHADDELDGDPAKIDSIEQCIW